MSRASKNTAMRGNDAWKRFRQVSQPPVSSWPGRLNLSMVFTCRLKLFSLSYIISLCPATFELLDEKPGKKRMLYTRAELWPHRLLHLDDRSSQEHHYHDSRGYHTA